MVENPKRIVEAGYDRIAGRFAEWQREITGSSRLRRVEELLELLPPDPVVLELGSGAAVRSTRLLAERGRLTGVDISREQVRRARERVPEATFIHGDVAELELEDASFDAVLALYVFNHLPRADLRALVPRVATWLRAGGLFLATYGVSDSHEEVEPDWLGAPMFFSSLGREESLALLRSSGLDVLEAKVETIEEPEGEAHFLWILARK